MTKTEAKDKEAVTVTYDDLKAACDDAFVSQRQCDRIADALGLGVKPKRRAPEPEPRDDEDEDEEETGGLGANP